MPKPLRSHLRARRMRSGLTQDDVAYLLGANHQAKVSRYERLARIPTLENLLALEVVYGAGLDELFPGIYEEIRQAVRKRAAVLAIEVRTFHTGPRAKRKLATLEAILRSAGGAAHN